MTRVFATIAALLLRRLRRHQRRAERQQPDRAGLDPVVRRQDPGRLDTEQ